MSSFRRRAQRIRRRAMRRTVIVVVLLWIAWGAGLFWFAGTVPHENSPPPPATRTDAIVVLTGGVGRLEAGLKLLAEGLAQKVFVSGVARGVDVAQLLRIARRQPEELACCIAVGYSADNTAGNARETAVWMKAQGYASMRLVTANYHMPRSLVEFHAAMPGIEILPHPVFPEQFKLEDWWRWPGTAALLASEYNKYLLARAQPTLRWPEAWRSDE
jgi:uncharacterized SAM-binding protein YcdF (DUF218 family)